MAIDDDEPLEAAPKLGSINEVVMHPLVLLSAADHYHRVARGTRKRVVGILLGSVSKGVVDCTNSFAIPFEEDSRNPVRSPKDGLKITALLESKKPHSVVFVWIPFSFAFGCNFSVNIVCSIC